MKAGNISQSKISSDSRNRRTETTMAPFRQRMQYPKWFVYLLRNRNETAARATTHTATYILHLRSSFIISLPHFRAKLKIR